MQVNHKLTSFELQHVSKQYREDGNLTTVLHDVNIVFHPGEFFNDMNLDHLEGPHRIIDKPGSK